MTRIVREPFCPLYREAIEAAPWKSATSAHAGLLFDKFADAWRFKREKRGDLARPLEVEFDKGVSATREGANEWINRFERSVGDASRLTEACTRQRQMVMRLDGCTLLLKNADRFVTGMGRQHPLKNGFAWHHTLGVPYLPGSSLKGMLRAWTRETEGEFRSDKHGRDVLLETEELKSWFGTPGEAGRVILLDMIPAKPPSLSVDVMTPHYGPYYQKERGDDVPGDWHSPNPIPFLTVEGGGTWQLGILPAAGWRKVANADLAKLTAALLEALEVSGAGAKTAVGYGRFERDEAAEEQLRHEHEQAKAVRAEAERLAAEQRSFEASIANDSEPLRQLKRRQHEQNWKLEAADANLTAALQKFAAENAEPPEDCLDWIRDLVESIPNYQGVWDDPEATKGKAKNPKPKYSSKTIRELVKSLNPQLK